MDVGVRRPRPRRPGSGRIRARRDVLADLGHERDALLLEAGFGARPAGCDGVEHVPANVAEVVVLRHGLGLAADATSVPAAALDAGEHDALGRRPVGPLRRGGQALLAQELLGGIDIAVRILERALAVHHPRAGQRRGAP